ncbi:MAG: thioredoxin domain-containing protein [Desulfurivibrio sp.]|nr:thioredoxin domain-containing protein [Desulfurivibrio sp.]MBU3937021.1 thioredoxin domain-containing protein [Pseudomonadota bacterium]MBU4117823.1 thioredoxin domain-containing protein [Pseudomonadota bacterium]
MAATTTIQTFVDQQLAQGKKSNRLITEKSPYLLQHAFNPVAWFPWGEEAFALARKENKPIFLSIGYSTCHWCHVMAHESFENPEIARILNENFICIKVDREERPDLDQIYMAAVQALTGHGGWPMSVFLTPDLQPFYGGTYFPPEGRHGLPGFTEVLEAVHDAWRNRPDKIVESAANITDHLRRKATDSAAGKIDSNIFAKAFQQIETEYDTEFGGFGRAPKFPRPVLFNFLLRHAARTGETQALNMTLVTLRKMAAGGMYDHLGGGFHRYSVDAQWRVPHFEKMLYDQGQLAINYLEAFQLGQDPFYANVAQDILDYVLRDMTSPEGGFYSAEDADSIQAGNPEIHGEGLFYLWTREEIVSILGKEHGEIFSFHYGVLDSGNALSDPQEEFTGKNILYIAHPLEETAGRFRMPEEELSRQLERSRQKLYTVREQRPKPHRDDKIITSWNGHMISALARAAQVLGEKRYLVAAERAATFIRTKLYDQDSGLLFRRYRDQETGLAGQLDDYAFMVNGLLDLYEASFDIGWLQLAITLTEKQITLFGDESQGGFFETSGGDSSVLVRLKGDYDGAEPTGNSVSALNLLRLAWITDNEEWIAKAGATIEAFGGRLNEYPPILPQMLVAHEFYGSKPRQFVIAGKIGRPDTEIMLAMIRKRFLPGKIVLLADGGAGQEFLGQFQPILTEMTSQENKTTVYLCENFSCQLPTSDLAELAKRLDALEKPSQPIIQ